MFSVFRHGEVFRGEISDILARSAAWKTEGVCSTESGNLPGNVRKNRYKDQMIQEEGHGDYINGNFIWVRLGVREGLILASYNILENGPSIFFGKNLKSVSIFWAQEREPLQIGLFCITLTRETWLNTDIVLRTLQVTFQKKCPSVYQLQYMSWPDRGVPSNPEHVLTMVEEARRLQGSGPSPLCVHCRLKKWVLWESDVLCTVDYVRQLLLTQMIPPNFSLFNVVLEMRNQRPAAVQTEEQYRFLYHTVAQMFSALQNTNPLYQNFKEHCGPVYEDALSFQTSLALTTTARPVGEHLGARAPGLAMADTYAVVQKRGAPAGPGAGAGAGARGAGAEEAPLYSQVGPRARRPPAHAEDARGLLPGGAPADQSPAGPDAYEDVVDGPQTGGLGFNLRIGRPKGPRDPPADWSQV
ncbi:unnamed protein product [Nyctereutes procyonoides]|uniref:protein-tyrosine-phosphatase n=1 Tax=Nyctereutes procyonoides TaxID=34880 RepID=A0A811Y275_NYCPR|nr:unnamed protein product [Nyctereutes procyonoides]